MKYPVRSKRRWCRLRGHDWADDVEVPEAPSFLIYRECRRCGEREVARRLVNNIVADGPTKQDLLFPAKKSLPTYTLSVADLSGVETTLQTGTKLHWLLFLRDIKRQNSDPKTTHYRVCDEDGQEVEWPEKETEPRAKDHQA